MRLLRQTAPVLRIALALSAALMFVTSARGQVVYWQQHTPLIDGDDVSGDNSQYNCAPGNTLYKCQYKGFLYGDWNHGSNTPETNHDLYGRNVAAPAVQLSVLRLTLTARTATVQGS